MARKLDFKTIDDTDPSNGLKPEGSAGRAPSGARPESETEAALNRLEEHRTQRWRRREANPTVQMSVRMREDVYERFRLLCVQERRTNGEMLEELVDLWLTDRRQK